MQYVNIMCLMLLNVNDMYEKHNLHVSMVLNTNHKYSPVDCSKTWNIFQIHYKLHQPLALLLFWSVQRTEIRCCCTFLALGETVPLFWHQHARYSARTVYKCHLVKRIQQIPCSSVFGKGFLVQFLIDWLW